MRQERFYAKKESRFADDCSRLKWDLESVKPKVSDNFHSDITDAVLYAFREALHWLHEPAAPPPPAYKTPEWFKREEDKMEEIAENLHSVKFNDDFDAFSGFTDSDQTIL